MIETGKYKLLCGDALVVLRTLPADSIDCCITSPPYYGLRDYGTGAWDGGDPDCQHSVGGQVQDNKAPGAITTGVRPGVDASVCRKCGATRIDQQIGLEPTPAAYIARLVEVFREVRRVLRAEGTLWVNIGDSYANDGKWGGSSGGKHVTALHGNTSVGRTKKATGLKPKDLIGIPWLLAFALRNDGWWLRQDIIWHKPNPMPESVRDRCTKAHEYIFMLSKSARYWWDAEAVMEPASDHPVTKARNNRKDKGPVGASALWGTAQGQSGKGSVVRKGIQVRNRRSVWTFHTRPSLEPHFATFPPELPSLCIRAGCPSGGVVLDPFAGICTTGTVSLELGRRFIGIELNPMYLNLGRRKMLIQTAMGEPDVEGVEDESHE